MTDMEAILDEVFGAVASRHGGSLGRRITASLPSKRSRRRNIVVPIIADMAAQGKTRTEIAGAVGMCSASVRNIAKELGISIVRGPRRTEKLDRNAELVGMYRDGVLVKVIAAHFGVSVARVVGIVRRAGLRRNKMKHD